MSSIYYRFASKLPIIGSEGSGSVSGYWTIWQVSRPGAQPVPVKMNLRFSDLKAYRGKLWMRSDYPPHHIFRAFPAECPHCGLEYMREEGDSFTCYDCRVHRGLSDDDGSLIACGECGQLIEWIDCHEYDLPQFCDYCFEKLKRAKKLPAGYEG